MTDLDKMARELLAAELARDEWASEVTAAFCRHPRRLLTAPPGYVLVPVESDKCQTCGTAIKSHPLTGTICDCGLQSVYSEGVADAIAGAPKVKPNE